MDRLESERILLRPIESRDNEQVFSYRSDAVTNKYQGFVPKTLEDVNNFIAKLPAKINQPDSWFQFVIIDKKSKMVIGDIGIHFIGDDGFQCELGCTLSKYFHGKGLATEAMKNTIDYLFNSLNKHRLICSVDPNNSVSIKLLGRLNFRKEAHFKKSLLIDGEWTDDVIFALLKSEWKY